MIQKKRYGPLDYLASALLCLGLVVFTLADISLQASYSVMGRWFFVYVQGPSGHLSFYPGLILICTSLVADAVIGNVQEKAMHTHKTSTAEMVGVMSTLRSYTLYSILPSLPSDILLL